MDTFGAIGQQPIAGPQWTLLQLASGAYSLTGSSALLTQLLTPTPGVYTINGRPAALLEKHLLKGAAGSYALSGASALLTQVLKGAAGSYALTGAPALLTQVLTPTPGVLTINGAAAKLLTSRLLKGAVGSYALTGASANPVVNQINLFANGIEGFATGGTLTANFAAAAPAGSIVVAFIYAPPIDPTGPTGTSPVTAFADSESNTWTLAGSQALVSSKGTLYVYWSFLATALSTSDTFTVTATAFNSYIELQLVINCYKVGNAPLAGVAQDFFSSAAALFLTTPTPSSAYDLMVGCAAFCSQNTSGTPTFALDTSDGWGGAESDALSAAGGLPEFSCVIGTGWLQDATTATKTFQPTAGGGLTYNTPGLAVLGLKLYNVVTAGAVGAYAIGGAAARLIEAHVLGATPGAYAYTGFSVAPDITFPFTAGAYALNGTPAALRVAHALKGAAGGYAIAGAPAALLEAHKLPAAPGSYALTGFAMAPDITFPVGAGIYALNGDAAALLAARELDAAPGNYSLVGYATAPDITFPVGAGAYALNGAPAALLRSRICAATGIYRIYGFDASLATFGILSQSDTLLRISGFGVLLYQARGLSQSLETIKAAQQLQRTVRGALVDISHPAFRKYSSKITCTDINAPPLNNIWPGMVVTVECAAALCYLTGNPGSPDRPAAGNPWVVGDYTFYRPVLTMMVKPWNENAEDWKADVVWELELEEV